MKPLLAVAIVCLTFLANTCTHEASRNMRVQMQLNALSNLKSHQASNLNNL